jgi:hypothetical protein
MIKRRLGWYVVSAHRKRAIAFKVLEYHAENGVMPKKKKKRRKKVKAR